MWHHPHQTTQPQMTFHFPNNHHFYLHQKKNNRSEKSPWSVALRCVGWLANAAIGIRGTRSLPPILPKVPPSLGVAERSCQPRFANFFLGRSSDQQSYFHNHWNEKIISICKHFVQGHSFPIWFMADLIKSIKHRDQHGFYARCNQRTHHLFSNVHRLGSQISPVSVRFGECWQLANWWARKDQNEVFECVFVFLFICIFVCIYVYTLIYIYAYIQCAYILRPSSWCFSSFR